MQLCKFATHFVLCVVSFQVNSGWSGRCFRVLNKYLASTLGFRYLSQYKSPKALSSLYGGVDVTWACYPPIGSTDWNLHWARPNRFYESCLFCVPLISRAGSCDAVDIANYKICHVVDSIAVQDADDNLEKISRATTSRDGRQTCALFRRASISTRRNSKISRRR